MVAELRNLVEVDEVVAMRLGTRFGRPGMLVKVGRCCAVSARRMFEGRQKR